MKSKIKMPSIKIDPKSVPTMLDDKSAAAFFGVRPRTMRLWRTRNGLPYVRVTSRIIRYRMEDLQAWMDKRVIEETGGAQ